MFSTVSFEAIDEWTYCYVTYYEWWSVWDKEPMHVFLLYILIYGLYWCPRFKSPATERCFQQYAERKNKLIKNSVLLALCQENLTVERWIPLARKAFLIHYVTAARLSTPDLTYNYMFEYMDHIAFQFFLPIHSPLELQDLVKVQFRGPELYKKKGTLFQEESYNL